MQSFKILYRATTILMVLGGFLDLSAQTATELLKKASNRLIFQNYKEALIDLNKAFALYPEKAELINVYFLRGKTYAGLKLHTEAIVDYTSAIKLDVATRISRTRNYPRKNHSTLSGRIL